MRLLSICCLIFCISQKWLSLVYSCNFKSFLVDKAKPSYITLNGGARNTVSSFINKLIDKVTNFLLPFLPSRWKRDVSKKPNVRKKSSKKSATEGSSRIQREVKDFIDNPPENCRLSIGSNIRSWIVTLKGAKGSIFEGEKYKLKMEFPRDYPSKPPSVYFLKPCPKHVHVYTNGDICLNLLGKDWRPTMTGQTIAVSILSMLSSGKEKAIPQDNAHHADKAPGQKQDNFMYHDDRC